MVERIYPDDANTCTTPLEENSDRPTFYHCTLDVLSHPEYHGDGHQLLLNFMEFLHEHATERPEHGYTEPYMDCLTIRNSVCKRHVSGEKWCRRYRCCERFYDFAVVSPWSSPYWGCEVVTCVWDSNDGCIKQRRPSDFIRQLSEHFGDLVFALDVGHDDHTYVDYLGQYILHRGKYVRRSVEECVHDHIESEKLMCSTGDISELDEATRHRAMLYNLRLPDGTPLIQHGQQIAFRMV